MTLRQLIDEVGISTGTLKELEGLEDFKTIENLDIITRNDISKENLSEYFNSDKLKKDIIRIVKGIHSLIQAYPQHNLTPKNFFLFFMPYLPLKLEVKPLVG